METIVTAIVLILILGLAALYVVRAKKRGEKCVGCPYAKECAKKSGSACGGHCH